MRLCKFLDSVNAGSLPVNAWAPVRLILEVDTGVDLFLLGAEAAGSNRIDFLTLVTDGMDMDCSMNFEVENPNKTPIPSVVFDWTSQVCLKSGEDEWFGGSEAANENCHPRFNGAITSVGSTKSTSNIENVLRAANCLPDRALVYGRW
ncbi:hypothetical protein PDE_03969 [Penicillium oxalicum 114-2]|uniref:Uncharacterized protein n=1 Tax=Penicillium oxalicum (strain 114-2 / CGMCC 5302) TaxID=933388 RepID=S8ASH3_PENO1|nr:hypothetical protein PDE_03969 [Penicillium oxalicum 114-2]